MEKINNLINRLRYLGNEVNLDYKFRLFKTVGYKDFILNEILSDRIRVIHLSSGMRISWKKLRTKKQVINKIEKTKTNI